MTDKVREISIFILLILIVIALTAFFVSRAYHFDSYFEWKTAQQNNSEE